MLALACKTTIQLYRMRGKDAGLYQLKTVKDNLWPKNQISFKECVCRLLKLPLVFKILFFISLFFLFLIMRSDLKARNEGFTENAKNHK